MAGPRFLTRTITQNPVWRRSKQSQSNRYDRGPVKGAFWGRSLLRRRQLAISCRGVLRGGEAKQLSAIHRRPASSKASVDSPMPRQELKQPRSFHTAIRGVRSCTSKRPHSTGCDADGSFPTTRLISQGQALASRRISPPQRSSIFEFPSSRIGSIDLKRLRQRRKDRH